MHAFWWVFCSWACNDLFSSGSFKKQGKPANPKRALLAWIRGFDARVLRVLNESKCATLKCVETDDRPRTAMNVCLEANHFETL